MTKTLSVWIETTFAPAIKRTQWRLVAGSEVLHNGETIDDVSGSGAYLAAESWIRANGHLVAGWKHTVDQSGIERDEGTVLPAKRIFARREPTAPTRLDVRIETTFLAPSQRTTWRVVIGADVVAKGEIRDDPSGVTGFEAAREWVEKQKLGSPTWIHTIDQTSRTRTDQTRALRVLTCATGSSEYVDVTLLETAALEARALLCPICGEACAPRLEPVTVAPGYALSWSGTRWRIGKLGRVY